MHVFLYHMHASFEHRLGLGVEDNNPQDPMNQYGYLISLAVAHNNLGLGWSIAAEQKGTPQNSIDYLSIKQLFSVFFSNSFDFCVCTMLIN